MEAGEALYMAAVDQARKTPLYEAYATPDTVEGRFEQVALHVYLIMRRLKGDEPGARQVNQKLFDAMFQNIDAALRELGVGDLSVGKKIRKLAENFFGRIAAYEDALDPDAPREALVKALARNIYEDEAATSAVQLAEYVRAAAAAIDAQPAARITGGIVQFPDPAAYL